jgi:hypothetical protein
MLSGPGAGQILLGDRAADFDAPRTRMAMQGAVGQRITDA